MMTDGMHMMMGGGMLGGMLIVLLILLTLIGLGVTLLIRTVRWQRSQPTNALRMLDARLASGDIDPQEYQERRQLLQRP